MRSGEVVHYHKNREREEEREERKERVERVEKENEMKGKIK
jgi:hypothetical protein